MFLKLFFSCKDLFFLLFSKTTGSLMRDKRQSQNYLKFLMKMNIPWDVHPMPNSMKPRIPLITCSADDYLYTKVVKLLQQALAIHCPTNITHQLILLLKNAGYYYLKPI